MKLAPTAGWRGAQALVSARARVPAAAQTRAFAQLQSQTPTKTNATAHALSKRALAVMVAGLVGACTSPPPPPPLTQPGLAELLDRPAERALFDGIRAYDEGSYETAEIALRAALGSGLRSARDRALAHKLMAFIQCTSNREMQCEAAFRLAREADPTFRLSRAEAGHPLWGPVFRRVVRLP